MRRVMKFCSIMMMGALMSTTAMAADAENTLLIETKYGTVVVELIPEKAPNHVARIKELARKKFYDGVVFHRVMAGFMAQTGDPTGTGTGGSDLPDLKAEFNDLSHRRGVMSMARSSNPNSANSQFFIVLEDSTFLDRQYTAFGRVLSGMEFMDKIKKSDDPVSGMVKHPDKMISVKVAADVAPANAEAAPAKKAN
jgi:peptidylprolyl isomerase